jgi:rRNA maturation RNase YbeY
VVKNLSINFARNIDLEKKIVHNLVYFLKQKLNFNISSLIINFISAELITKINEEYLDHHYSTDIITFNYTMNHILLDGELYISVENADNNARRYGISAKYEYFRLVIHGILHLLNYNDLIKEDKMKMKRIENKLLKEFINNFKRAGSLA